MKKIVLSVIATFGLLAGCKTVPSEDTLFSTSYAIGVSTALVINQTKISDADRNVIIEIMNEVKYCCPTAGQTVVDAWSGVAKAHIAELVKKGEITEIEGQLILKTFDLVASAGDYMIRIRWSKIGQYTDLVLAATNGFCDGFLVVFKPANVNRFAAPVARDYDVEAYNYLMSVRK